MWEVHGQELRRMQRMRKRGKCVRRVFEGEGILVVVERTRMGLKRSNDALDGFLLTLLR